MPPTNCDTAALAAPVCSDVVLGKYGVTRRAQVPRRSFDKLAAGETSPCRMELLGPASGVVANDCNR
jgi:hypothetical protein